MGYKIKVNSEVTITKSQSRNVIISCYKCQGVFSELQGSCNAQDAKGVGYFMVTMTHSQSKIYSIFHATSSVYKIRCQR